MQKQIVHRLYTEDVNRQTIADIVSKHLTVFTIIYDASGIWQGVAEKSLIIETIGSSYAEVQKVAEALKDANNQQAVLYTAHEVKTKLF